MTRQRWVGEDGVVLTTLKSVRCFVVKMGAFFACLYVRGITGRVVVLRWCVCVRTPGL